MSQPPYPPQPRPEPHPEPRPAHEPAYDPAYPPEPTGPMPGAFPSPPPLPGPEVSTSARVGAKPRTTADRAALTATALGIVGLLLLLLGLSIPVTLWSATTGWAVFATIAALVSLLAHVPSRGGLSREQAWQVGAAGAGGVGVFWLLVVVFSGLAASDRGFVLTLATGLIAGGIWLGRREI